GCGSCSVFAAVHGDEDGHGDEGKLPEAVVDHEVQRDEDAVHGSLLEEEHRVEDFFATLDCVPTGEYADWAEESDEDYEQESETIDADVIGDGGVLDPGLVYSELKAGMRRVEVRGKMQREAESGQRDSEREPFRGLAAMRQ